ncbi:bifunctional 3-(3-hydroxy-phenyl)propionate/3-hydroxycinnamic acid hydroxylase [Dactylosporangium sp. NPDC049525]|uniref:bifunctional 3-(3-hydroxy-phenyl)propionate/3-hydroxycinnamic acid hydroxylase MhpA n=1 Tax=Dactylosporangium sp. NPDC049525 TaxID=3154730 RepID=UPI003436D127
MNYSHDVAIVGYGPVGQLLAILLGSRGHRVVVVERYTDIYALPRAVHLDHEVARILQRIGIRPDEEPIIEPYDNWYEWRNAAGQTLLRVDWRGVGPSWWHTSNFFAQPDLERALDARVRRLPTVEVRRGLSAIAVGQDVSGVTLTVAPLRTTDPSPDLIRARYLVGCDGANSTIRNLLGLPVTDLGFFFDWLILDMIPDHPLTFDPPAWQLCDPRRPTTIVPGGPGRRRWEFMALPGEDINELNKADTAWELLRPWGVTPDNAQLERHTVYRFQSHWADRWRKGRVLIAGDAAHLMPPFAGQGMCAGLRDVFSLDWKLDLLLRGQADDALLDTYGTERTPHVRYFIDMSISLGQVICVPDAVQAEERDTRMIAALNDPSIAPPAPDPPRLGAGVFAAGDENAGLLSIQSEVLVNGVKTLFDDVAGYGWRILTTADSQAIRASLSDPAAELVDALEMRLLGLGCESPDLIDVDGRYSAWFAELGAEVVVVRPDFYVYAATTIERLDGVLGELAMQLGPGRPTAREDRRAAA